MIPQDIVNVAVDALMLTLLTIWKDKKQHKRKAKKFSETRDAIINTYLSVIAPGTDTKLLDTSFY